MTSHYNPWTTNLCHTNAYITDAITNNPSAVWATHEVHVHALLYWISAQHIFFFTSFNMQQHNSGQTCPLRSWQELRASNLPWSTPYLQPRGGVKDGSLFLAVSLVARITRITYCCNFPWHMSQHSRVGPTLSSTTCPHSCTSHRWSGDRCNHLKSVSPASYPLIWTWLRNGIPCTFGNSSRPVSVHGYTWK